jgi:uncharacterized protein YtpQ (UPF0354 family)
MVKAAKVNKKQLSVKRRSFLGLTCKDRANIQNLKIYINKLLILYENATDDEVKDIIYYIIENSFNALQEIVIVDIPEYQPPIRINFKIAFIDEANCISDYRFTKTQLFQLYQLLQFSQYAQLKIKSYI